MCFVSHLALLLLCIPSPPPHPLHPLYSTHLSTHRHWWLDLCYFNFTLLTTSSCKSMQLDCNIQSQAHQSCADHCSNCADSLSTFLCLASHSVKVFHCPYAGWCDDFVTVPSSSPTDVPQACKLLGTYATGMVHSWPSFLPVPPCSHIPCTQVNVGALCVSQYDAQSCTPHHAPLELNISNAASSSLREALYYVRKHCIRSIEYCNIYMFFTSTTKASTTHFAVHSWVT